MRATYSKAEKEKAQPRLRKAAADTLAWGQKNGIPIHIFAAPYRLKVGRWGTNGSRDAAADPAENCSDPKHIACRKQVDPLAPFKQALNPCIRLDYSRLVAIDVDHGLEGLSDEEALAKAEKYGLPRTLVIRSGRPGGMTFVYRGVRDLSDSVTYAPPRNKKEGDKRPSVPGFQIADLSGDIKHRGHIAAPGSLHANGTQYRVICDTLTDLPEFWATYTRDKARKQSQIKAVAGVTSGTSDTAGVTFPEQAARVNEYAEKFRADLISGKRKLTPEKELVREGRFNFLQRKAGALRKQQWEPEMIRHALDLLAVRKCKDGLNYIRDRADGLSRIAGWSRAWGEGDFISSVIITEDGTEHRSVRPATRDDRQKRVLRSLPDRVLAHEVYERMAAALQGTAYTFKPRGKHLARLYDGLKAEGYAFERDSAGRNWWVRQGRCGSRNRGRTQRSKQTHGGIRGR